MLLGSLVGMVSVGMRAESLYTKNKGCVRLKKKKKRRII